MNDPLKPGRGWRILRRILISLAILATLIAALYTEEDWRGKQDWETYKYKWEAKGEKFDWQAFVPPTAPNDRNFFTAPIFTNMLDGKIAMVPYGQDGGPDIHRDARRSGFAVYPMQMTDLQAWQSYYRNPTNIHAVNELVMTNGTLRAQTNYLNHAADEFPITPHPQTPAKDVLLALSKYASAVEALRQASERPYANVPLPYEKGLSAAASTLLPSLATLKRCTQLLQLRADAELANGQTAQALDDVKLLLFLNNSLRNSPFLISALVRIAMMSITVQPIWEGLAQHQWSDEQLVTLDTELAKMDFLAEYEFAMRGERAWAIATLENQRRTREVISVTASGYVTNKLFSIMPSAYFYQNELAYARMIQQWMLPLVNAKSRVVSPEKLLLADQAVHAEMKHYSPYKVQALMIFPAVSRSVIQFACAQSSVDLARVACALERYRLVFGKYPKALNALSPRFIAHLPHDIMNGQSLHYRRTDDGNFVLYSVGWNETDDGGKPALTQGGNIDKTKGDWVWQYPVKSNR